MTDKHTPGPWTVSYRDGDLHIISADGTSLMCDMTYYPWVPKEIADWHLIAAATDMLAALRLILKAYDGIGVTRSDIDAACAAIAKATGADT